MAFWTYMLKCADGRYYTGHTDNLEHRIGQHQTGEGCSFTSKRRPVTLVWNDTFGTRIEALDAERIIGGWWRAKKEALIAGNWSLPSPFAKPPHERQPTTPFVSSDGATRARGVSTSLNTNGAGAMDREGNPCP
ncbi:MAG: GIY-YIG nuclease family protein [bacterium]|nr:GIY-YIG nuclease family protein [bacterium]